MYCFSPLLPDINRTETITPGNVVIMEIKSTFRHTNKINNGKKSILCCSTAPVKVIMYSQELATCDAYLSLPMEGLGSENDKIEYYTVHWDIRDGYGFYQRILLLAMYDKTVIQVTPADSFVHDGIRRNRQETFSMTLDKYRTTQFAEMQKSLTGTRIVANKPIVVYSGNMATYVPSKMKNKNSADQTADQLLPTKYWGDTFVLTPYPSGGYYRLERHLSWYKIISAKAGTKITLKRYMNTTLQETIEQTLDAGINFKYAHLLHETAYLTATSGIMVAHFSTNQHQRECVGDPWLMVLPPVSAFEKEYLIMPPILTTAVDRFCRIRFMLSFLKIIIKTEDRDGILVNNTEIGKIPLETVTTLPKRLGQGYAEVPGSGYSYVIIETRKSTILSNLHAN